MPGTVVFRPMWHLISLLFPACSSNSILDPSRGNVLKIWEPLFPPFGHERETLGSKVPSKIDLKTRTEAKGWPKDTQSYPRDTQRYPQTPKSNKLTCMINITTFIEMEPK